MTTNQFPADPVVESRFRLPASRAAKVFPGLIADDEAHFAAIAAAVEHATASLKAQLAAARRHHVQMGQDAVERDAEIRRLAARLRAMERYGVDLCLGRIDPADGSEPLYVGRLSLSDASGDMLLIDWRSPAAEPFFAATHAHPMGLRGRRRYRWHQGSVTDYWDERFDFEASGAANPALEDLSEFIASLGESRSSVMCDVLGTIAADQDAIIRAPSRGALVVDGGPGTGKTVVALHRAAYLIYADPRVGQHAQPVLFVGPNQRFLNYVADVLPSLGEEGVQSCTLRNLIPEGAAAVTEDDPLLASLKSTLVMKDAVESAVAFYEQPPVQTLSVDTPWGEVELGPCDWADAFATAGSRAEHNTARAEVWEAVLDILVDRATAQGLLDSLEAATVDESAFLPFRRAAARNRDLVETFSRAWPLLKYTDIVGDLWRVPAYLRLCAPWLSRDEVAALQRRAPSAWTDADLPLLDAARHRLGDLEDVKFRQRQRAQLRAERDVMERVTADLIAADDSELMGMTMLKGADLAEKLAGQEAVPGPSPDALLGPFAHVVVDEAQELTDSQWQMLLRRCPSGSFTIVGDRAQARHGFSESWEERLTRLGMGNIRLARLGVNYRTPGEVMAVAEPAIRAAISDANVPTSIRSSGLPVEYGSVGELDKRVAAWLAQNTTGTACVVSADPAGAMNAVASASWQDSPRVQLINPEQAKGLEFDLVVLLEPDEFGTGFEGAVDRYVAMTRSTRELVILSR